MTFNRMFTQHNNIYLVSVFFVDFYRSGSSVDSAAALQETLRLQIEKEPHVLCLLIYIHGRRCVGFGPHIVRISGRGGRGSRSSRLGIQCGAI